MSARKLKAVPSPAPQSAVDDLDKLPINVINHRLNEAHATVDLLYAVAAEHTGAPASLGLHQGTLAATLHSVMCRIEEAQEAAAEMWETAELAKAAAKEQRP
jgi:hypothetical protein